ncbi:recombinase family protein, partial [Fournierella sp.]|uniref:recombinase family protein n=1 Tax=Allofournierella sp. TaxID=1940256 RepID=UPI0025C12C19
MTRAALYCRLSREDEGLEASAESESIQNQRAMLLAWAERLGCQVQGIYCDEDYSGADRDRPAFNRMLAAARAGQIDVILAKSQSRFTRDMELVEKYLHGLFPVWGVRFLALVDHVDTGDPAGKKSRQIYGLMNEWYLEDLSANVRAVLTHKRRQGCSIASSPLYGYQKDPAQKGHLLPDESTAPVVER